MAKMEKIEEFKGILKVLNSGLRIGGSKEGASIGETDNPIIRHPITRTPYVPGSSVKGKIRCLLESKHSSDSQRTGLPCSCGTCLVCQLFGCHDSKKLRSPTRLVFRDCQPTEETLAKWRESGVDSELKTEVLIDRNKGTAYGRVGPRTTERIPAFCDFEFAFSIRTFSGDPIREYYNFIAEGFELLEKHYLGGYGSRGYGKVAIVREDGKHFYEYLRELADSVK